jgi:hypothetical protein
VSTFRPSTVKNLPLWWRMFPVCSSVYQRSRSANGMRSTRNALASQRSVSHRSKCSVCRNAPCSVAADFASLVGRSMSSRLRSSVVDDVTATSLGNSLDAERCPRALKRESGSA